MCASRPSLDVHLGNMLRTMYVVFTRYGWANGGLQTPQGGRGDGQEAQDGGLVDLFGAHRRVGECLVLSVSVVWNVAWGMGMGSGWRMPFMAIRVSRWVKTLAEIFPRWHHFEKINYHKASDLGHPSIQDQSTETGSAAATVDTLAWRIPP